MSRRKRLRGTREHRIVLHKSSTEIVDAYLDGCVDKLASERDPERGDENLGMKRRETILKNVRKNGFWGFADVPHDPRAVAEVHLWWRKNKGMDRVCELISHELGHITGANLDGLAEEDRANGYAEVACKTVMLLIAAGKLRLP